MNEMDADELDAVMAGALAQLVESTREMLAMVRPSYSADQLAELATLSDSEALAKEVADTVAERREVWRHIEQQVRTTYPGEKGDAILRALTREVGAPEGNDGGD